LRSWKKTPSDAPKTVLPRKPLLQKLNLRNLPKVMNLTRTTKSGRRKMIFPLRMKKQQLERQKKLLLLKLRTTSLSR
jgi:hypothetical protein